MHRAVNSFRLFIAAAAILAAIAAPAARISFGITQGADVKVTNDNNNVDAGYVTPAFDGRNLEQEEPSIAISPKDPNIIAVVNKDARRVIAFDDFFTWTGLNVSTDGGATWTNTFLPGFPTDTSPEGLASPLKGFRNARETHVRFDADGNLFLAGVAVQDFGDTPGDIDRLVFLTKYTYTPGSPAGASTTSAAGNPPNFAYAFTTVVDRGSSRSRSGGYGKTDQWAAIAIDTSTASSGFGNIYYAFQRSAGNSGSQAIVFCRSTDGGRTFSPPIPIAATGQDGSPFCGNVDISLASEGTVYVGFTNWERITPNAWKMNVVRSVDFGAHFSPPVTAAVTAALSEEPEDLAFPVPNLLSIAADDTDSNTVYIAYAALFGATANGDIFVQRSTNGGITWGAPVRVNDDSTSKHQFWPTLKVSNGAVHVAWYDLRESPNPDAPSATNDVLHVYYACSNAAGFAYPAFNPNVKVTDPGFQPNCRLHNTLGMRGHLGNFIELAAHWDGENHVVHVAWTDNRDIPADQCDLDSAYGPILDGKDFIGRNNQNIYTDRLVVSP